MIEQGRYMHQSCIVKGRSGFWSLMVMGGKVDKANWTNSVEALSLLPYFRPGTMTNKDGVHVKL